MSKAIVWFRKDLRLTDNEALHKALKEHEEILFFYCFEEIEFATTSFGFPKTDSHRAKFLLESVEDLRAQLRSMGSDLIIRKGSTARQLEELQETFKAEKIYCSKDIHYEEIKVQKEVEKHSKVAIEYVYGSTLYHVNDLPHSFADTPKVFTQFRKGVEKRCKVRGLFDRPRQLPKKVEGIDSGELPSLNQLGLREVKKDPRAAINAVGGERAALKRLKHYLYEAHALVHYKESRNGLLGENYSSKFSLWLWNGCISPRTVYWEIRKFEEEVKKNQSTYWLIFELIWRDFFKFIALKHGNQIFQLDGIKEKQGDEWSQNEVIFQKWAKAETGVPFIDANMRELNQTGFMSNRGRQNVASFLVNDLGIDWRMGAEYFESKLIDYDVASNYGNWMYIAGVGNDPRDRYFNVISQAKRYDQKGKYVKHWLPELQQYSEHEVHHPWTSNSTLFKHSDYPRPIVEPAYWRKYY